MIDRYSRPKMKRIWSDSFKYKSWLLVELAACEAWHSLGIIPLEDIQRLRLAKNNLRRFKEIFSTTRHDVTAFLRSITENMGKEGRWLHIGLTSSDVIDTAQAVQLKKSSAILLEDLEKVQKELKRLAIEHKNTIMMGRTHGIHAEPITFGLKMALWHSEISRHIRRLQDATKDVSVGKISGAVGTHATVPLEIEEAVCKNLGLSVAEVSNQIIQRDRYAYFMGILAVIASSLEKFAVEVRSLQKTEVQELQESFGKGQTGSSSMPHKKNPELSERICGIARLLRGFSVTSLENVALWHERDISHSSAERIILPDACLALDYILDLFYQILSGLVVYPANMKANLEITKGMIFSQRVLTKLIECGLSREESYAIVQNHALTTWENGTDFRDLLNADSKVTSIIDKKELNNLFDYSFYTKNIQAIFDRLEIGE